MVGGKLMGLIALANSQRDYSERDLEIIIRLSSFYAVALHRKQIEDEFRKMSLHDDLTGIYNRRGFLVLAQQQLKLAKRSKRGLLLVVADLDGLKKINDTFGHEEGDMALKDAAYILKDTFRESDIIGRIGGDEFAIVMLEDKKAGEETLNARLQEGLNTWNAKRIRRYKISISIGISRCEPESSCLLDKLISEADTLMYEQKRSKKQQ
jgi:diguanylate cyclase (GGDEF)-like protein